MVKRAEVRAEIDGRTRSQAARPMRQAPAVVQFSRRTRAVGRQGARPVLMAVAAKGGVVAEHFGHAREFLIYEASPAGVALHRPPQDRALLRRRRHLRRWRVERRSDARQTIRALEGCEVVLCSKIGYEPWGQLEAAGIPPNGEHAMEPIEEAVMAV